MLRPIAEEDRWPDWQDKTLATLAVRAARVHLAVDLEAELELSILLEDPTAGGLAQALRRVLPPSDVVLALLSERIASASDQPSFRVYEVASRAEPIQIPRDASQLRSFAHHLDKLRQASVQSDRLLLPLVSDDVDAGASSDPWKANDLDFNFNASDQITGPFAEGPAQGLDLAILGWRRWRVATTSLFLAQACQQVLLRPDEIGDSLRLSIVGTLGLFQGYTLSPFTLHLGEVSLGYLVDRALRGKRVARAELAPTIDRVSFAVKVFRHLEDADAPGVSIAARLEKIVKSDSTVKGDASHVYIPIMNLFLRDLRPDTTGLLLYLLSPEPLEALALRLLGIPDVFIQ